MWGLRRVEYITIIVVHRKGDKEHYQYWRRITAIPTLVGLFSTWLKKITLEEIQSTTKRLCGGKSCFGNISYVKLLTNKKIKKEGTEKPIWLLSNFKSIWPCAKIYSTVKNRKNGTGKKWIHTLQAGVITIYCNTTHMRVGK